MALDFSAFLPPYQTVELPSRGKFYKHNPALADGKVNIREYCAQEESMLAQMNQQNVQQVLNNMIDNCLQGDAVTADELTTEDAFYLLVWLRANSYGPSYDISITCPFTDCNHEDMYTINLSKLTINVMTDEDPDEPITVKLPKTGLNVEVRCMRRSMEIQAAKRATHLKQMKGLHKGDVSDLLKRAYSISKVVQGNGKDTSDRLEIEELCLKYLPAADSLIIDQTLAKFEHGVDVNVEVTCHACSRQIFTVVPPGPEFFRPAQLTLETEGEPALGNPDSEQVRATGRTVSEEHQPLGESEVVGPA
jgi:hypothetical protein